MLGQNDAALDNPAKETGLGDPVSIACDAGQSGTRDKAGNPAPCV